MHFFKRVAFFAILILSLISGCAQSEAAESHPTSTQVPPSRTLPPPSLTPTPLKAAETNTPPTPTTTSTPTETPEPTEITAPTATATHPPKVVFRLHPVQGDSLLPISNREPFQGPFNDPGGVVYHEGAFHMFYNVLKDFPPTEVVVGYARSEDGIDWEIMTDRGVISASQVPFAHNVIRAASALVEEDGTWVLYFETVEDEGTAPISVVGRATAKKPGGPWQVDPEPVLTPTEGSWDAYGTMRPFVVKTEQGYSMYYQARDSKTGAVVFGLAKSEDGIQWVKHHEPVFTGEQVNWGAGTTIRYPTVVKEDWGWVLFFRTSGRRYQNAVGMAASQDGVNWALAQEQPIFETADTPAWTSVFVLRAAHVGERWVLFLELENLGVSRVHLATFKKELIPGENIKAPPPKPTEVKAGVEVIKDIAFGRAGPEPKLDVYRPTGAESPSPVVLMLHQGNGRKEQFISWGKKFAEAGYAVVASNYRGWPNYSYPQDAADAFCALAWIHTQADDYGFDPQNIYVLGHSSGGTLAALLAVVDDPDEYLKACPNKLPSTSWVQGAITFTGIFDYASAAQSSQPLETYINTYLGSTQTADPDTWTAASAIHWITGDEPPFLVLHGQSDQNIPARQSEEFAQALEKAGVSVELVIVPDADHNEITGSAESKETTLLFIADLVGQK